MSLADAVFLGMAGWTAAALVGALWQTLRGRPRLARRQLRWLGVAWGLYGVALVVMSARLPQRRVAIGEARCFDDWCLTVTAITREPADEHQDTVTVTFQLSNRAKRRPMGERGTVAFLRAASGERFDALPAPREPAFADRLPPGGSATTRRRFAVPHDATGLGVIYAHEGGFPIEWLILGAGGWLSQPPAVAVPDSAREPGDGR